MVQSKIAALFDIDGTIFRDSLMVAHFKKMVKYEIIPEEVFINEVQPLVIKWNNREISYDTYLDKLVETYQDTIESLPVEDVEFAARQVIATEAKKQYVFTRERLQWHKEQGHTIIFISGSPDFLVDKLAELCDADLWFGTDYLVKHGRFTGEIVPMWDSVSKEKTIERLVNTYDIDLEQSYAYGDTNGDFLMLSKVGHPIAINPNEELLEKIAKELSDRIEIRVERKNVVYKIDVASLYYKGE